MPGYNLILNLPGFTIVKVSGYHPLILDVVYQRKACCCHCKSKEVRKKSSKIREVHHELIGHRRTLLRFKAYKLYQRRYRLEHQELLNTPCPQVLGIDEQLSHQVKNNRGILALLRTRADRLTPDKQKKRDAFLAQNPAIEAIYQFQQQLHQLLMNKCL